jgi:hypothetical protein
MAEGEYAKTPAFEPFYADRETWGAICMLQSTCFPEYPNTRKK